MYECVDPVVRVDGSLAHNMQCSDFNFDGVFDGIGADGTGSITAPMSKYENGDWPPGQYLFTISGTTEKATVPLTGTAQFTFTLKDPCNPPKSLQASEAGFVDQKYELGSKIIKSYTHPAFRIEPEECKYETEYIYTKLADGRTAVAQDITDDTKHYFYWAGDNNDDLFYPFGQTENVRVVARSYSKYGTDELSVLEA